MILETKNLSISVAGKDIITGLDLKLEKDTIYVLMGPNGSGKSTLSYALMGHPAYTVKKGRIFFKGRDITGTDPDKRAKLGMFLSFQNPLFLSGVNVFSLLRTAMAGKKEPLRLRRELDRAAAELNIKKELLARSFNEGASGGEKKKMELLQAAILKPDLLIFDEIDTGVDVDALKTLAGFMDRNRKGRTYLIITHYNRILKHVRPDRVLVMVGGRIVDEGDSGLAVRIEEKGYADYT